MRFSIQEEGKPKMIFHTLAEAEKQTGLNWSTIENVLSRNSSRYHRKSDQKLFFIKKEPPVKILTVQGKDFFFLEEIRQEFGLSPTKFKNRIKNQNFPHKIDWISPEILPRGSSFENYSDEKSEWSELQSLREKMRKQFEKVESLREEHQKEMRKQFEKVESLREEHQKEMRKLSARVLKLETVLKNLRMI